jgi:hypothetical protein
VRVRCIEWKHFNGPQESGCRVEDMRLSLTCRTMNIMNDCHCLSLTFMVFSLRVALDPPQSTVPIQYCRARLKYLVSNGRTRSFQQLLETPERVQKLLRFLQETRACGLGARLNFHRVFFSILFTRPPARSILPFAKDSSRTQTNQLGGPLTPRAQEPSKHTGPLRSDRRSGL